MSEAEFKMEVEIVIRFYENEIGHDATRTWPMIEKYGKEALSRLMKNQNFQKGFKVLRDRRIIQILVSFPSVSHCLSM